MIIIFDLDYTLFDTNKIKEDIAKILDIDIEQYNKDCIKYLSNENKPYNPYELIRILKSENRISLTRDYISEIEALVENGNKYLFSESLVVVKKLKERGDKLILMTVGYPKWQEKKVNSLEIKKYFDKIIFIPREKYKNLDFLNKEKDNILIINDNAGETLDMKKAIGKCEVCLIDGPYSRNVEHNLKIYKLKDLL